MPSKLAVICASKAVSENKSFPFDFKIHKTLEMLIILWDSLKFTGSIFSDFNSIRGGADGKGKRFF